MIGMMMRDEDVPKSVERHAGGQELSGAAIPAIYDIRDIVDQEKGRRVATARRAYARPAFRAEQNYSHAFLFLGGAHSSSHCVRNGATCEPDEEPPPTVRHRS